MDDEKKMIAKRLKALREERASGEKMREELQQRLDDLNATMMRIEGAIQVLEELLGPDASLDSST